MVTHMSKTGQKNNIKSTSPSSKGLKPKRITKRLRDSIRDKGVPSPESKGKQKTAERIKDFEEVESGFNETFLEYVKMLSSENTIVNAETVGARKEVVKCMLDFRFDTERCLSYLAYVWSMSLSTIKSYAQEYYESYTDKLPYSRVMAARKAIKEYNDIIEMSVKRNDLATAKNALQERNKLMGINDLDFWNAEDTAADESVQFYIPDNNRESNNKEGSCR